MYIQMKERIIIRSLSSNVRLTEKNSWREGRDVGAGIMEIYYRYKVTSGNIFIHGVIFQTRGFMCKREGEGGKGKRREGVKGGRK